jgi:uridine kinase
MKYDIIGIAGKAHAGKDTVANLLLSLFQVPTYIYHFADPIKQHLCDLLKVLK